MIVTIILWGIVIALALSTIAKAFELFNMIANGVINMFSHKDKKEGNDNGK